MTDGIALPAALPLLLLVVGAALVAGAVVALTAQRVATRARLGRRPGRRLRLAMPWTGLGRWATGAVALLGAAAATPDAGAVGDDASPQRPLPVTDPATTARGAAGPGVAVMVVTDDPDSPRTSLPTAPTDDQDVDPTVRTVDPASGDPYAVGSIDQDDRTDGSGATGAPSTPAPEALVVPGAEQTTTHVVEPGDHLWGIAEEALALRLGRPPTAQELVPYWRTVIDSNTDRLVDPANPDLILPGQVIDLPE